MSRVEQGDRFDATSSITICAFTSDPTDAPLFRLVVEPTDANGLETISRLMVDKITTIPKAELGRRIAKLADDDLLRLNRADDLPRHRRVSGPRPDTPSLKLGPWSVDASGRSMDAMVSPGSRAKWYYRPAWVLVLLFLVLGPIALPILWRSPSFSRPVKVVLTVLVLAYMALFVDETIRVFRAITSEMDVLGTVPDF